MIRSSLLLGICTCVALAAEDAPFLHPLFSDHAVLQRGKTLPVWGWSTPGDTVVVTIAEHTASTVAGADGRWQADLAAIPAGGPYTLTAAGAKTASASDLLVGDVWLCSGQSNMEWTVNGAKDAETERNTADFPRIRQFTGTKRFALTPQKTTGGGWAVCNPTTVGNFTAVGYFFGRELTKAADVPIGLVNASWGGTRIESWTSGETLAKLGRSAGELQQLADMVAGKESDYSRQLAAWWTAVDPAAGSQAPATADGDWKAMELPSHWEERGLPDFDGVVWFRRTVDIPAELAGKEGKLLLGPIDDQDVTWINGTEVGHTDTWNQPRVYAIGKDLLKTGANTLAIRTLDTGGPGGLYGKPEDLRLEIDGKSIPLAGAWKFRNGKPLKDLPAAPARLDNPNVVTSLSNGMIEPLVPMAMTGAIWYQGEANAWQGSGYEQFLPAMIADWRTRFANPDLPFGIVQLANFMPAIPEAVQEDSGWAWLRETQLTTFLTVPHTGLAVITDIGDAADIHPRNKQDVGRRLASWALHDVYDQADKPRSGPVFLAAKPDGAALRLSFRYAIGGLKAVGELKGFAVAGENGPWVAAEARINGETLVVSSPQVAAPVKVRYAWANNPACTLYNGAGLPASPFRSDGPLEKLKDLP